MVVPWRLIAARRIEPVLQHHGGGSSTIRRPTWARIFASIMALSAVTSFAALEGHYWHGHHGAAPPLIDGSLSGGAGEPSMFKGSPTRRSSLLLDHQVGIARCRAVCCAALQHQQWRPTCHSVGDRHTDALRPEIKTSAPGRPVTWRPPPLRGARPVETIGVLASGVAMSPLPHHPGDSFPRL